MFNFHSVIILHDFPTFQLPYRLLTYKFLQYVPLFRIRDTQCFYFLSFKQILLFAISFYAHVCLILRLEVAQRI